MKIIDLIKQDGLEETVKRFNLKKVDYGHKFLLKYSQLASVFDDPAVCECRGLVLTSDLDVMSYPFDKFFNVQEDDAHKIDWDTATVYKKLDGTMIQVYYDWIDKKWYAGTTGSANGEGTVNNKEGSSFNNLFWKVLKDVYKSDHKKLKKGFTYIFELTTPYNIVVKQHNKSEIYLLAARNVTDHKEMSHEELQDVASKLRVPMAPIFNLYDLDSVMNTITEDMHFEEEGYVVCDDKHRRVKIKNPAYVAAHHVKSQTAPYRLVEVVQANEVSEFIAVFPEKAEKILEIKDEYDQMVVRVSEAWEELKEFLPKNITPKEKKKFAMNVFRVVKERDLDFFKGVFFSLKDRKAESVKEAFQEISPKKLYTQMEVEV